MAQSNFLPWLKTKVSAGEWYPLPARAVPLMVPFVNDLLMDKTYGAEGVGFQIDVRDDGALEMDYLGTKARITLAKDAAPIVGPDYREITIDEIDTISFRWQEKETAQ